MRRLGFLFCVGILSFGVNKAATVFAESNNNEKTQMLFDAISRNDELGIRLAIDLGADLKARDSGGWTPLHHAAGMGNKEFVGILLRAGASVHAQDNFSKTSLFRAAEQGHGEVGVVLLCAGADINHKGFFNMTPLHCAANNGHAKMAALLCVSGADIKAQDSNGCTPLHLAVNKRDKKTVTVLLFAGADDGIRDNSGQRVLANWSQEYWRELPLEQELIEPFQQQLRWVGSRKEGQHVVCSRGEWSYLVTMLSLGRAAIVSR